VCGDKLTQMWRVRNHRAEEDGVSSREKAIRTVVAGHNAENLLDLDNSAEEPASSPLDLEPSGIATSPVTTRTAAPDPLADLMGLFDSVGLDKGPTVNGGGGTRGGVAPVRAAAVSTGSSDLLGDLV
jgi:hypothetical protein